jgi:predicted transcriptional regulator
LNRTAEEVQQSKDRFLELYKEKKTVTEVAEIMGVTTKCIYDWIKEDEDLGLEHAVRRSLEKYAPIDKIIKQMGAAATENLKIGMPNLAAGQYLLNARAPHIFGKYKEQRKEGKITHMTVRKDKGKGKIETEEYDIEERTIAESNGS